MLVRVLYVRVWFGIRVRLLFWPMFRVGSLVRVRIISLLGFKHLGQRHRVRFRIKVSFKVSLTVRVRFRVSMYVTFRVGFMFRVCVLARFPFQVRVWFWGKV